MWSWLNPVNLIKIYTIAKELIGSAVLLYEKWLAHRRDTAQKEKEAKVKEDIELSKPRDEETRKNEKDWLNS